MSQMYIKSVSLIIALLISTSSFSQEISGTWVGNYGRNLLTPHTSKLVVEINIYNDSLLTGMSHLYYRNNHYEHYRITGVYHKKDSTFTFREDSVIAVKLGLASNCMGNYKTKLTISDSSMRQEGRWKDQQILGCPSTGVWLEKPISRKALESRIEKPDQPANIVSNIMNRETAIQKFVEVPVTDKDSIRIEIYDNGIIDNDSVSVFIEDREIVHKHLINAMPLTFYVSLDHDHPIQKIRLVAESLGSIPPCTAVMIITSRHKREEVNLSSNFNKNATVEFFLKN